MTVKKKEFCLWVVPTDSGQVKKIRVSARKLLAFAGIGLSIAAFFLFIASDYARVQVLRARSFLSIQQLTAERNSLNAETQELKSTIESLESKNELVVEYERNIRDRVEELDRLIETAASMGMIPPQVDIRNEDSRALGGEPMGGAELDCVNCENLNSSTARLINLPDSSNDLLRRLDSYLELISTLPLGSPANGHLSSGFGMRRSPFSGQLKMHQGLDFSVPVGSSVLSTGDGIVKSVKRTATYGRVIDIDHGNGITTRYAHLSDYLVEEGDRVCRGQEIGLAGSTGRSTGPHLHYEIRRNGKALNPNMLLQLARKLYADF